MQVKQKLNKLKTKFKSLCSKIKQFCIVHGIPTIVFPIAALLIIATLALIVGGSAVGWNIAAALTSSTAILVYAVLGVLLIALIYYYLTHR